MRWQREFDINGHKSVEVSLVTDYMLQTTSYGVYGVYRDGSDLQMCPKAGRQQGPAAKCGVYNGQGPDWPEHPHSASSARRLSSLSVVFVWAMSLQSLPHTRMAATICLSAMRACLAKPSGATAPVSAVMSLRHARLPPQFSAFLHYSAISHKPSLEAHRMPDHAIVEPGPSRAPGPAASAKKTREFKARQAAVTMVRLLDTLSPSPSLLIPFLSPVFRFLADASSNRTVTESPVLSDTTSPEDRRAQQRLRRHGVSPRLRR
jgi:hypothetical protein